MFLLKLDLPPRCIPLKASAALRMIKSLETRQTYKKETLQTLNLVEMPLVANNTLCLEQKFYCIS